MRIIGLFNKYFLAFMLIQGFVLAFIDSKSLRKLGMKRTANRARILGIGSILVSVALYFIAIYIR